MDLELKVHKGNFEKGTNKLTNEVQYTCNFITDDDETITLYLDEEKVKPFLNLKKYDICTVHVRIYKSQKGKYGIVGV